MVTHNYHEEGHAITNRFSSLIVDSVCPSGRVHIGGAEVIKGKVAKVL